MSRVGGPRGGKRGGGAVKRYPDTPIVAELTVLNPTPPSLGSGDSWGLSIKVEGLQPFVSSGRILLTDRTVIYSTSNAAVATVNASGAVSYVGNGTATVTATCEGVSKGVVVTCVGAPAAVATVTVSPSTVSRNINVTAILAATPRDSGSNALVGRTVTWGSSNEAVATVGADSGTDAHTVTVTPVGEGTATITATCETIGGTCALTATVAATGDWTLMPAAAQSHIPNYALAATVRAQASNTNFTEPVTGRKIWKLGTSSVMRRMGYSGGGPRISRLDAATGKHYVLVTSASDAQSVWDFDDSSGFTNQRNTTLSGLEVNNCFSTYTATALYGIRGGRYLDRHTVTSSAVVRNDGGYFPKDLSLVIPGWVDARVQWLTISADATRFCFLYPTSDRMCVWDSTTDVLVTKTGAEVQTATGMPYSTINEGYISLDGRYVWFAMNSPSGDCLWDTTTGNITLHKTSTSHAGMGWDSVQTNYMYSRTNPPSNMAVSGEGFGYLAFVPVTSNGQASPTTTFTNGTSIYGKNAKVGGYYGHSAAHFADPQLSAAQQWVTRWVGWGINGPEHSLSNLVWSGSWTLDSGAIYYRDYNGSAGGVPQFGIELTGGAANLTLLDAGSKVAMTAGTCFVDTGTSRVYCWRADSAAVTASNVGFVIPRFSQQAVHVRRGNNTDFRHVAHTLNHPGTNGYTNSCFVNASPDGLVIAWNSDFGSQVNGTTNVCAMVMPT